MASIRSERSSRADAILRPLESAFSPNRVHRPVSRNTVIIALSVEYNVFAKTVDRLGIATLSTADLVRFGIDAQGSREVALASRTFAFGDLHPRHNYRLYGGLFGSPERFERDDFGKLMTSVLAPVDTSGQPCDVIVVGHNLADSMTAIQSDCEFNLTMQPSVTRLIEIKDAFPAVYDFTLKDLSLCRICRFLEMKADGLGHPGNDAMYTLKVLLSLYTHHKWKALRNEANGATQPSKWEGESIWLHRLAILHRLARMTKVTEKDAVKAQSDESQDPNTDLANPAKVDDASPIYTKL